MVGRMRLKDKICAVTGGGRGIGEAISRLLVAEGATVHFFDIDKSVADEGARSLRDRVIAEHCDVSHSAQIDAMVPLCRRPQFRGR